MAILIICFAYFLLLCCVDAQLDFTSHTNFEIKRFEICNNTQGLMKFRGSVIKEKGEQYLTFDIDTPTPWDENVGLTCLIETRVTEKVYAELFTIREKDICKAAKMYLGEFWYDITMAMSEPNPRACPLPAGRFHAHHVKLDFHKISLQTFPFGRLRFTIKAINNRNPATRMLCLLIEVENYLN